MGEWDKGLEFMVEGTYLYIPDNEIYKTATADSTKVMLFTSSGH